MATGKEPEVGRKEKGLFAEGNEIGKGGRPKGLLNSMTKESQSLFITAIKKSFPTFQKRMEKIDDDYKFCQIYLKMCEMGLPKVSAMKIDTNDDGEVQTITIGERVITF